MRACAGRTRALATVAFGAASARVFWASRSGGRRRLLASACMADARLSSKDVGQSSSAAKRLSKGTGRSSKAPKRSSNDAVDDAFTMRSGTPTRTCPSACPSRRPGHRIGPAVPGLPVARDRPAAPIPAARGAGKCQDGLSRKRKYAGPANPVSAGPACVPADLSTNPKHIAAIPNGIARTPDRTNRSPTPTHAALPTATHVPRRGRESLRLRQELFGPTGRRVPPMPQPAWTGGRRLHGGWRVSAARVLRTRRRQHRVTDPLRALARAYCCGNQAVFEGGEREQRHFRSA